MAFKTNMSTDAELDKQLILLWDQMFIISAADTLSKGLPSLATVQRAARVKTFNFTIYSKLTVQTSALTDDTEATREAMADSQVTITPAEYGNVAMPTNLVDAQSGGQASEAAVRLMGINMKESLDKKFILTGEAGANEITVNASGEASTTAANVLTAAIVKRAHNKLARAGIPGPYIAIAHDDVIYDLKIETGSGAWTDVNMYTDANTVLNNEIGKFGGFRWLSHPQATVNTDAGNANVDTYHSQFFGWNAFGYGQSQTPEGGISGPFDNMARFVDYFWYGIYEFSLIDTNAHWLITSASSIGSNT